MGLHALAAQIAMVGRGWAGRIPQIAGALGGLGLGLLLGQALGLLALGALLALAVQLGRVGRGGRG